MSDSIKRIVRYESAYDLLDAESDLLRGFSAPDQAGFLRWLRSVPAPEDGIALFCVNGSAVLLVDDVSGAVLHRESIADFLRESVKYWEENER